LIKRNLYFFLFRQTVYPTYCLTFFVEGLFDFFFLQTLLRIFLLFRLHDYFILLSFLAKLFLRRRSIFNNYNTFGFRLCLYDFLDLCFVIFFRRESWLISKFHGKILFSNLAIVVFYIILISFSFLFIWISEINGDILIEILVSCTLSYSVVFLKLFHYRIWHNSCWGNIVINTVIDLEID